VPEILKSTNLLDPVEDIRPSPRGSRSLTMGNVSRPLKQFNFSYHTTYKSMHILCCLQKQRFEYLSAVEHVFEVSDLTLVFNVNPQRFQISLLALKKKLIPWRRVLFMKLTDLASEEIPHLLWKPEVNYCVHNSQWPLF